MSRRIQGQRGGVFTCPHCPISNPHAHCRASQTNEGTKHSCTDLRSGSDLQRSGTGVGPGSELKMGHICMGTFRQGPTCEGPGPGSDPVPN